MCDILVLFILCEHSVDILKEKTILLDSKQITRKANTHLSKKLNKQAVMHLVRNTDESSLSTQSRLLFYVSGPAQCACPRCYIHVFDLLDLIFNKKSSQFLGGPKNIATRGLFADITLSDLYFKQTKVEN